MSAPLRPVHFSDLKNMAQSAAHYVANLDRDWSSAAMVLGRVVHAMVLGRGEWVVYPGKTRRGKEWDAFRADHGPDVDIVNEREYEQAKAIAKAVMLDPVAAPFLRGRHELAVEWEYMGRKCATRGIDIIGELDSGQAFIADLKTSNTTAPWRFGRKCDDMGYDAQLAFYDLAARSIGVEPKQHYIIGVETSAPHAVTVLRLTPERLELGRRKIHAWMERLLACESSGHWPGYAQSVVEWDAPAEPLLFGDEDEDEDDNEESEEAAE